MWGGIVRLVTALSRLLWRNGKVVERVREWGGGSESGVDCLIDEMQVLVEIGWKHL